jgi:hypothetical protein
VFLLKLSRFRKTGRVTYVESCTGAAGIWKIVTGWLVVAAWISRRQWKSENIQDKDKEWESEGQEERMKIRRREEICK